MDLELHTSAPSVELANDATRNARCKECNHIRVVYMNAPGLPMRYACKEHGYKLCVDICDEACPKHRTGKDMTTPRKCSTCKHFKVIDKKSIWKWGTCTKPGQTMTEEAAAACGCPCWEVKE